MDKLFQKRLFNGQRTFEIVKKRYLVITSQSLHGRKNNYRLDILALNPERHRLVRYAWSWLISAGLTGILTLAIGLLKIETLNPVWNNSLPVLTSAGGISSVTLLILFIYRSSFEQVYTTRHSGIPLVHLFSNKPDRDRFQKFTQQLETIITELSERYTLTIKDQLAGEMKMLRRLVREKIITAEAYEKAKTDLFQISDEHSRIKIISG